MLSQRIFLGRVFGSAAVGYGNPPHNAVEENGLFDSGEPAKKEGCKLHLYFPNW